MDNNHNPNPIGNLAKLLQDIISKIKNLIVDNQWPQLFIHLSVILFFLFAPETGFLYFAISKLISDEKKYSSIFLLTLFSLCLLYTISQILSFLISQTVSWIKILLIAFSVALIIFTVNIFLSQINSLPIGIEGRLSFGMENLFLKDSPEEKIYENNKEALKQNKKPLKIAISLPISISNGNFNSNELLKGVAVAQDEWNKDPKNKNLQVLVGIADDGYLNNDSNPITNPTTRAKEESKSVAEKLVKQKDILAVIGHNGSDVTQAAAPIYEGKLVAISPTSTAIRQTNGSCASDNNEIKNSICLNEYIFRAAIDDVTGSDLLVKAISKKHNVFNGKKIAKVAIAYSSKNTYSNSFKSAFQQEFEDAFEKNSILSDKKCDLDNDNYKGQICFDFARENNVDAILLIPGNSETAYKTEEIITENFKSKDKHLVLLGSDTMYQQPFVEQNKKERKDTEGMLIPLTWHRSVLDECSDDRHKLELECKAATIFSKEPKKNQPLAINWRTATAYESTKAILEGLKIAKEEPKYCGGFFNFLKRFKVRDCMRKELRNVLVSDEFENLKVEGATSGTPITFEKNGERAYSQGLGVVVEARNKNFQRYFPEPGN